MPSGKTQEGWCKIFHCQFLLTYINCNEPSPLIHPWWTHRCRRRAQILMFPFLTTPYSFFWRKASNYSLIRSWPASWVSKTVRRIMESDACRLATNWESPMMSEKNPYHNLSLMQVSAVHDVKIYEWFHTIRRTKMILIGWDIGGCKRRGGGDVMNHWSMAVSSFCWHSKLYYEHALPPQYP